MHQFFELLARGSRYKKGEIVKLSSSTKILIVDDDPDMRAYLSATLSSLGFKRVECASNAKEALTMLGESYQKFKPFSIVLADWQMPGLTGIDLLSKIKIDSRFKETIFIMLTSESNSALVMQAINRGVDNYLVKPVEAEILLKKIKTSARSHH